MFLANAKPWKWVTNSSKHRQKFTELLKYGQEKPGEVKEINGVRVCCLPQFRIGEGSQGTLVYVGLAQEGYERAVKRLQKREANATFAQQEQRILNEPNAIRSNHVVRYWSSDDEGKEYAYVILGLCEENLENYVKNEILDNLVKTAPKIISHILKGLADLHGNQPPILHRDVKPPNIMRDVNGDWLLADFGISRFLPPGKLTYASSPRGTLHWIAAESYVEEGKAKDDEARYKTKSDIQVGFHDHQYDVFVCRSIYVSSYIF